jgi:hypothetical protein
MAIISYAQNKEKKVFWPEMYKNLLLKTGDGPFFKTNIK